MSKMIRQRRKSFYSAKKRITEQANLSSSLSTAASSQKNPKKSSTQPDPPVRTSGRLRGEKASASQNALHTIDQKKAPFNRHEQAKNAKISSNLKNITNHLNIDKLRTNENVNVTQPAKVVMRRVTVGLDRLNQETINRYLDGNVRRDVVAPNRITTRRCTVNLTRMDLSRYRALPAIQEDAISDADEENADEPVEDDAEMDTLDDVATETTEKSSVCVQKTSQPLSMPIPASTYSLPFSRILPSVLDDAMETEEIDQSEMDAESESSEIVRDSLSKINLDDDIESTHYAPTNATTYFSAATAAARRTAHRSTQISTSTDESTQISYAQPPVTMQQLQSSQTREPVPWLIHGSVSDDSLAVRLSKSSNDSLHETSVYEPKKCFVDSEHVSYDAFVQFGTTKFAVNQFDQTDDGVRHYFLSKFCRSHLAILNAHFEGYLHVTDTTARLLREYSNLKRKQIIVMQYDTTVSIENISVTAIEVPKFPGGALFFFEPQNKRSKSILHVGNFRLTSELEANSSLMYSIIDDIRFDKSVLSGIFYQFPPCIDRYIDLMNEIYNFHEKSRQNGLSHIIAVGAFEIGMEFFLLLLANNFNRKIYMPPDRREFLRRMESGEDSETIVQKLLKEVVEKPSEALIHVVDVDEISQENLMRYIAKHNYQRVFGIRPRGCDIVVQTVVDGTYKIVDIANPLIGDIIEYERFVHIHTQRTITKPIDHEWTVSNKVGNQSKLEQNKNRETPKKQTQPQNN